MELIQRLADLQIDGDAKAQRFVRLLVLSHLAVDPTAATDADWNRAWRAAQRTWEKTVADLHRAGVGSIREAQAKAVDLLERPALLRLERRTFADG